MRRWNGWGDSHTTQPVSPHTLTWLQKEIGPPISPTDAVLEDVASQVPPSQLPAHPLITDDPIDRVQHARGQSLPDWIALRHGRIPRFPDGIAYPQQEEDLTALYAYARRTGTVLIPYGGGTSVVGGINPNTAGPPTLTIDLSRLNKLQDLDEKSRLARFEAGITGPHIEAALRVQGYTLGHFPQSFELSTLGGWIATRSSGQQSLYYGRIEDLFAGGRLVTPTGTLVMNPYPASAAGPDLRQFVLGCEGRMGIINEAIVRISPLPEHEEFHALFFPDWQTGCDAVRALAQAQLPLSMMRLSNARETEVNLIMAGHKKAVALLNRALRARGHKRHQKVMLLMGITGSQTAVRHTRRDAFHLARQHGGLPTGQSIGKTWLKSRFLTPYLRNTLWQHGYAVDTLETIVPWNAVTAITDAVTTALHTTSHQLNEKIVVFSHLSHVYPTGSSIYTTFIMRVLPDPDQQLAYWQQFKQAASQAIVAQGGSITHQHGIGVDHAPYLEAEKGKMGMDLIASTIQQCDPDNLLNPGKLIAQKPETKGTANRFLGFLGMRKRAHVIRNP